MKRVLMAAAATLALAACATATPYQPAGFNGQRGGYAEQRIEENRFRVGFAGNSVTSRETVESYLLYRAAELTVQNGYDWFATADRATDRDVRYIGDSFGPRFGYYSPFWGPRWRYYGRGYWSPWGGWADPFHDDFTIRQVDRFEASSEIVMGRGPKPAGDPNAFDAREVMVNLGPRVIPPGAPRY